MIELIELPGWSRRVAVEIEPADGPVVKTNEKQEINLIN